MKKSFLFISLLLAALVSCTNNEVIDVPQEQSTIQFKAPYVGKNTRTTAAAVITTDDVDHIHVFGKYLASDATDVTDATDVFTNVKLEKSTGYTSGVAWVADKLYSFAAYIDGKNGSDQSSNASFELTSVNSSKFSISNYTVSDNDLVVAMPEDVLTTTTSNYPVPLAFVHTLSKVRFTFTNEESNKYRMQVTDIQINGAYNQGNLVVSKSAGGTVAVDWNFENTHNKNGYIYTETELMDAQANDYTEKFVIPQNLADLSVTFSITLTDTSTNAKETMNYTASLAVGITSWTPRYAYNYNLGISAHDVDSDLSDMIKFTLTVNTWDNQPEQNLNPTQTTSNP